MLMLICADKSISYLAKRYDTKIYQVVEVFQPATKRLFKARDEYQQILIEEKVSQSMGCNVL